MVSVGSVTGPRRSKNTSGKGLEVMMAQGLIFGLDSLGSDQDPCPPPARRYYPDTWASVHQQTSRNESLKLIADIGQYSCSGSYLPFIYFIDEEIYQIIGSEE